MRVRTMIWLSILLVLFGFGIWHEHTAREPFQKLVALTFDDGPHPLFTPQVLDILKRYGIKATFFLIGKRVEKFPEIARRIVFEGHEVGNHTYSHPANLPKENKEQVRQEIEKCTAVIEKVTGVRPKLFRPPRGFLNYKVLMLAQLEGYTPVFWTVSADHKEAKTPEAMAQRVLKLVQPCDVILMHDGRIPSRWKDVKALPLIVEGLQKRGYEFVTVSELFRLTRLPSTRSRLDLTQLLTKNVRRRPRPLGLLIRRPSVLG
ncbi:MAG: polysaccharide deacetylase family protein, partial [Candidatus Fervidibacter sp.]|uniref:polysaccharide deacetylase family protein n=1 Tax=Candidatus Fervidibacter sp. TaxID=3100871 RepID=UPI004049952D